MRSTYVIARPSIPFTLQKHTSDPPVKRTSKNHDLGSDDDEKHRSKLFLLGRIVTPEWSLSGL